MNAERCTWCGTDVPEGDGYRLSDAVGGRQAGFCRLEHVVPWILQGARWESGSTLGASDAALGLERCAQCGGHVGEERLLLVRHRGPHRIGDALCSMDDLLAWAKAGGRWRTGRRS
jgi:hypothetical protein